MRSTSSSKKRSASRSTPTCAFCGRPVRFQRSTTVRPRQRSDCSSISTLRVDRGHEAWQEHVRDGDRVVDRERRPTRTSPGGTRRRSRRGRRRRRRRCPSARAAPAPRGSSRPGASRRGRSSSRRAPEPKTRAAASGSAQMLNSAAGVMFPSAMAPPISTIRSTFSPPMRSSRSATFVSGPVGTSVTGWGCSTMRSIMKSTACWATGRRRGAAASGPSSPLSPCTCAATGKLPLERTVGPGGDEDVAPVRRGRAPAARSPSSSRASGSRTPW